MAEQVVTLDVSLQTPAAHLTYCQIPPALRDFFLKCQENYRIVGFTWDGKSLTLGVALQPRHKGHTPKVSMPARQADGDGDGHDGHHQRA